ncbi:MAG: arylsulfate sulfotransferase, partial [Verrucomicrobiota bacterium]
MKGDSTNATNTVMLFKRHSLARLFLIGITAILPVLSFLLSAPTAPAATVTITGQSAGPTPFIAQLNLTVSDVNALNSIRFAITPKPGSVTRPLSATYFRQYLQSRGYLDSQTGQITLPVFGLYANYSNTVTLTYCFADGTSQQATVNVLTAAFSDPCGIDNPTVLQARTNTTDLSYDFLLVKTLCSNYSPMILDTDGRIRWVGTANVDATPATFFDNAVYIGFQKILTRIELDGTFAPVADYSATDIINLHHNNDNTGKFGMILDADSQTQFESINLEVDAAGNILKRWDLAQIISAAMVAGGDDPSQFVYASPTDWFHNNAANYRRSDDSLIVSSRENFVICIDYETSAIKWILGDTTKKWYQFPSLR